MRGDSVSLIESLLTATITFLIIALIATILTGCGHTQIGLVIVNSPALVKTSDKVDVVTDIGASKSLIGEIHP